MTDRWTPRLSEYLDGQLGAAEREALETHLGSCADCTGTLADLAAVVRRATDLVDTPPATDLWPAIAERLSAGPEAQATPLRPPRRRIAFTVPQLAAAALALSLVSAGAAWLLLRPAASPRAEAVAVTPAPGGAVPDVLTASAEASYQAAVADLRGVLEANRQRLDTVTVRILEQNLALIDRAIADARRALAADPANPYVRAHLAQTLKRKLDLLGRAASLAARAS